jgi:Uma2 family endonuclease
MTEAVRLNTSHEPVKLRVDDYLLLDASGAVDAYRKTELIDGEVFYMNAQHRPHARTKSRLHAAIARALDERGDGLEAIVEGSVALSPTSVPEPDIVITAAAEGDGLIPVTSIRLVIEVSDTTLEFDLGQKAVLYATAAIPEYWVADIGRRVMHQFWAPSDDGYGERREIAFGEVIAAISIAGLIIPTATI